MSRMGCPCGGTLYDSLVPNPWGADLLHEGDAEKFLEAAAQDVVSYLRAVWRTERLAWLAEHFTTVYPTDLPDQDVVVDIVQGHLDRFTLDVAVCESCGRLFVEQEVQRPAHARTFRSFAPDAPDLPPLFAGRGDDG